MSYATEGISRVRVRPVPLDLAEGQIVEAPGAAEVTWDSTCEGLWHQVYVNGRLAGVTPTPADRRLLVPCPAGPGGPAGTLLVEVVAVEADARWTDFRGQVAGFAPADGAAVCLSWQAGAYLGPDLESFDVFADGRSGTVDYGTALNDAPIAAAPGGLAPWGYGCGGYGVGAWGESAARYEWTTGPLDPGTWRLAVVAVDAAGNRLATAAEVEVAVAPLPRPPERFRLTAYDAEARTAALAWDPSPDLPPG